MSVGPDGTVVGAESSPEGAVSGEAGSDAAGGQGFTYDGETFNQEQLQEAIEAMRDRKTWDAAYKQRDQKHAAVRDAVQSGFGKNLADLDENDLRDLKAMGLINAKLRAEPTFAKAWEESLIEAYKKAGLSGGQAAMAAQKDVAAAKGGEPAKLPEEVTARLRRIDDFENMVVEQGLAQFEGQLEVGIKGAIDKAAGDLTGHFYPLLRSLVLQGLSGYSDVELLTKAQDGSLSRELAGLSREAAKTVRGYTQSEKKAAGDALAASKTGSAPAPLKGGTAEKVDETLLKPGGGLSAFHNKMRQGFGTS